MGAEESGTGPGRVVDALTCPAVLVRPPCSTATEEGGEGGRRAADGIVSDKEFCIAVVVGWERGCPLPTKEVRKSNRMV
jgi:hypothetical protein